MRRNETPYTLGQIRMLVLAAIMATTITAACTSLRPNETESGDTKAGSRAPNALTLSRTGFGLGSIDESVESITARLRERWGLPDESELKCESSATSKIVTWDGVLLVFKAEGLSGYLFGPKPSDPITPAGKDLQTASTVEGLGLGQSVADTRKIYGAKFVLDETSLGPEWYIDDPKGYPLLRGFASGLAETDTITHIGAGDICAVR